MSEVLLTIIICVAFASIVAVVLIGAKLAPKPPDLYLSINVVPEIEEDEGDDPDEDELEPDILPDERPEPDETVRSN